VSGTDYAVFLAPLLYLSEIIFRDEFLVGHPVTVTDEECIIIDIQFQMRQQRQQIKTVHFLEFFGEIGTPAVEKSR
jgi:hypothetical protein